jgi:small subunit ribosomal protein S7
MTTEVTKKEKKRFFLDPYYSNENVGKFINYVMRRGKKAIAMKIVYDTFKIIEQKTNQDALSVFNLALKNSSPTMEVRPKKVGGATYQIPVKVEKKRKVYLSLNWMIAVAKNVKKGTMAERLADEIIKASQGEGGAVKKKIDIHKMAEANKIFAYLDKSAVRRE